MARRLRHATTDDADALQTFDCGPGTEWWETEVQEIVSGVLRWRDGGPPELGRVVLVLEDDDELVGVLAHEADHDGAQIWPDCRYVMVVAVRGDRQRGGLGRLLFESGIAAIQHSGARLVSWLIAPANHASLQMTHQLFSGADETSPPDDQPYIRFELRLR